MRNRDIHGHTVYVKACLLDSVKAANLLKLNKLMLFACQNEVCGSERSFHNAAGYAEYNACAGVIAEKVCVKFFIGQLCKVDT